MPNAVFFNNVFTNLCNFWINSNRLHSWIVFWISRNPYCFKTKKTKNLYLISLLFAFSIGFRLSNIIFLIALIFYLILIKKDQRNSFIVVSATGVFSLIIYGIAYWSLWSNTLSTIYSSNISEVLCIFNLTNTDHDPISRLGRFVLKQASYLSVLGSLLFLLNVRKIKKVQFFVKTLYLW